MKSKTIWESASRPLFVRSIWLESPRQGRSVQHRHFILDYEPQLQAQLQRPLRSAIDPVHNWKRSESLRHSVSSDQSELSESNGSQLLEENLFLIGSEKIRLQQPISQHIKQQLKVLKFYKRPTLTRQLRKKDTNICENNLKHRVHELQEIYSRHSSLQDLQSTISTAFVNPEERLAERVLNWLDLAGKTELVKIQEEKIQIEPIGNENMQQSYENRLQIRPQQHQQQPENQLPRQQAIKNTNSKKKIRNSMQRNYSHQSSANATPQTYAKRPQRDVMKPITIIFNRDGFPVRLNRPPRNIDLCTFASNAGATLRLAGPLASARLYHGHEAISYKPRTLTTSNSQNMQNQTAPRNINTARPRNNAEVEKSIAPPLQKRAHEDFAYNQGQDSKRQLHIFMPSLPKKGMNSTSPSLLSAYDADDSAINLISHKLNESCKL